MRTIQAGKLIEYGQELLDNNNILSLDCFDTLLWRKFAQPADVFHVLESTSEYTNLKLSANLRIQAENHARRRNLISTNTSEVTLEDIYRTALPGATSQQIDELVNLEVDLEIKSSFIFQPVLQLMRLAKERGIRIVIVSDTYLPEKSLKKLLFTLMPELEPLIDIIFCSCDHGTSKTGEIWRSVISNLGVHASEIRHLGDNIAADLHGALRFGIQATHLEHYTPEIADIISQRTLAATQLLPQVRQDTPLPDYFHGLLSAKHTYADKESILGYSTLGPILYSFAKFVLDEADHLKSEGHKVKTGFLLRDGFLPSLACTILKGSQAGIELNISRFTSIAASLDSKEAIDEILANSLTEHSIPIILKQLLIPEEEQSRITRKISKTKNPTHELIKIIQQKKITENIIKNSAAFRNRLFSHLLKSGIEPGDTLMLVDLGYAGTTQIRLKKILKENLNIDIFGCYLIATETLHSAKDRKGLIDASWAESRTIATLTQYIAPFEMMCTQNSPSTIDYTEIGDPIFSGSSLPADQNSTVTSIQNACLEFIKDFKSLPTQNKPQETNKQLAHSAATDLARFIYFPTQPEVELLSKLQFDLNLGTDIHLKLFDPSAAEKGMRRQGFNYINTNSSLADVRMSYPTELRHIDLSLSNLLLSATRHGFPIQHNKKSFRRENIQVIFANNHEHTVKTLEAHATHDGFYALCVPIGSNFHTAILLGKEYGWIQIEALETLQDSDPKNAKSIEKHAVFDQMQQHSSGILELSENGMIYLAANPKCGRNDICQLTFRPLARR